MDRDRRKEMGVNVAAEIAKAQEERFQRECMGVQTISGVTIKQGSLFE